MKNLKIFGKEIIDDKCISQIENCISSDDDIAVLTADAHYGYGHPIGGAVAYKDKVSLSGVGFDIACIFENSNILLSNRAFINIKSVDTNELLLIDDFGKIKPANKNEGLIFKGIKPTFKINLFGGKTINCTSGHLILTKNGWQRTDMLKNDDYVLCSTFCGLKYKKCQLDLLKLFPSLKDEFENENLLYKGFESLEEPKLSAMMRLLGIIFTDGTLSKDGKSVSIYTSKSKDVKSIIEDIRILGFKGHNHFRNRGNTKENNIKIDSVFFHKLISVMGCPIGNKADKWKSKELKWFDELPDYLIGNFLSGVLSGEGSSPSISSNGTLANCAINQSGDNKIFLKFIKKLFKKLNFKVSDFSKQKQYNPNANQTYIIQILGGATEQIKIFEKIGYCYHTEKREMASMVLSMYLERKKITDNRIQAYKEARRTYMGKNFKQFCKTFSDKYGVPKSFIYHSIYEKNRGIPRFPKFTKVKSNTLGEGFFDSIVSIKSCEKEKVYDIVTSDKLSRFIANGIVVHNCGNKAVRTDIMANDIDVPKIMDEIFKRISFGIGRHNDEPIDHEVFDKIANADFEPQRKLYQQAKAQLGTVGSGNHYIDLFKDSDGYLWIGNHFGSRGFGHKTAKGFIAMSQGLDFDGKGKEGAMDSKPILFDTTTDLGQAYLSAMHLAGEYAYAGRDMVIKKVLEILDNPKVTFEVHNHHNFAWKETHFGKDYWVVRKGCTPAFPKQLGFIGANMMDTSVIVEGIENEQSKETLYSTVHGAGRVMSRTEAAGKKKWLRGEDGKKRPTIVAKGKVDFDAVKETMKQNKIELRGAGADEAPECYKKLNEVLGYMGDTIKILHELEPIGVAMAGSETHDPYKD